MFTLALYADFETVILSFLCQLRAGLHQPLILWFIISVKPMFFFVYTTEFTVTC